MYSSFNCLFPYKIHHLSPNSIAPQNSPSTSHTLSPPSLHFTISFHPSSSIHDPITTHSRSPPLIAPSLAHPSHHRPSRVAHHSTHHTHPSHKRSHPSTAIAIGAQVRSLLPHTIKNLFISHSFHPLPPRTHQFSSRSPPSLVHHITTLPSPSSPLITLILHSTLLIQTVRRMERGGECWRKPLLFLFSYFPFLLFTPRSHPHPLTPISRL